MLSNSTQTNDMGEGFFPHLSRANSPHKDIAKEVVGTFNMAARLKYLRILLSGNR